MNTSCTVLESMSCMIEQVIGCAYQVYNQLGFGYLESVYEKRGIILTMS